ncbi:MAG: hypothetical protein V1929_13445 [bacterium]
MNARLAWFSLLVFCVTIRSLKGDQPADADTARRLFEPIEQRFKSAQTLQYTVTKVSSSDRQSTEERWQFAFREPGLVRVDYEKPVGRILVLTPAETWEYIPAARQALRTRLDNMSADKRASFVARVLARVAVDGVRIGNYENLQKRVTRVTQPENGTNTWVIEGSNPKYVIAIDASRNVLLRSDIYKDTGELSVRTEASQFTEIAPGFWYPQAIIASYLTPQGYIVSRFSIRDIRLNATLPEDTFTFTPPEGVAVKEN